MKIAYQIFGQILKVAFCFIVLSVIASTYGQFEVTAVGLLFFLYAYSTTYHIEATRHRNAHYYSLIKSLVELSKEEDTMAAEMQMEFEEALIKKNSEFLVASIGNMLVYFISLGFIAMALLS